MTRAEHYAAATNILERLRKLDLPISDPGVANMVAMAQAHATLAGVPADVASGPTS